MELAEGLHWKIPLIQSIKALTVKVQKLEATSNSASKDLQVVQTSIALNYSLKPGNIVRLYQTVGDEEIIKSKIIEPAIQESVKASTALFTAEQLISKRAEVNEAIIS
jgi:regulator of protease activity HflC (stomatin/prohibitin superfamily)